MEQLLPTQRRNLEPETIYHDLSLVPVHHTRPYVAVNMVASIDGKITINSEHQNQKLGSPVDRALMLRIRQHFDGVLRGAQTVRANPTFPGVPSEMEGPRQAQGRSAQPHGIVVSASLELPVESDFFRQPERAIVLTIESSDPAERDRLRRFAEVEVVGEDELDLEAALTRLRERYGIERLLVEGGAAVNYQFMQAGMVDSLFCTLAPKVIGGSGELTMVEGPQALRPIPHFSLNALYRHENELFFHWISAR